MKPVKKSDEILRAFQEIFPVNYKTLEEWAQFEQINFRRIKDVAKSIKETLDNYQGNSDEKIKLMKLAVLKLEEAASYFRNRRKFVSELGNIPEEHAVKIISLKFKNLSYAALSFVSEYKLEEVKKEIEYHRKNKLKAKQKTEEVEERIQKIIRVVSEFRSLYPKAKNKEVLEYMITNHRELIKRLGKKKEDEKDNMLSDRYLLNLFSKYCSKKSLN